MPHLAKNNAIYLFFMLFMAQACKSPPPAPSHDNLRFDVALPSEISLESDLEYTISFTNMSAKPILVPDFILGGLSRNSGIFYWYEFYDESGKPFDQGCIHEYFLSNRAFNNKPIPLLPGETRSELDCWETKEMFLDTPGRYRIVFFWQGAMGDNKKGEVSLFSCERWIEVRK